MAPETVPLATRPFPSFAGIEFPRGYPVECVDDGDVIPLPGRALLCLKIPDHAVGSLCFLDAKARLLFTGDEIMHHGHKNLNGGVARFAGYLEKLLAHRAQFDRICSGSGVGSAEVVEAFLANARYILAGHEGEAAPDMPPPSDFGTTPDGHVIYRRDAPHPGDVPKAHAEDRAYRRRSTFAGCTIVYDCRRVRE